MTVQLRDPEYGWLSGTDNEECLRCGAVVSTASSGKRIHTLWHQRLDAMYQAWLASNPSEEVSGA